MASSADRIVQPVTNAEIKGLWRRAYIKAPAATPQIEDHDTQVYWFQADGLYADLRIPARFSGRLSIDCLADFSHDELLALAEAEAFAGSASVVDGVCTWQRAINLQGPERGRDIGRLERTSGGLFEYGVEADFVELWLEQAEGSPSPEGRVFTCGGGFWGFLITSTTRFLFAQDRPARKNLARPWNETLAQALSGDDRDQLNDLFRTEYSFGRIDNGVAVIELSSHPNRVDAVLSENLRAPHHQIVTHHARFDGEGLTRHWNVAELNGWS